MIQKISKELITKRMQRGLRVITLQGAIKKSRISYSGGSNNIFADCTILICVYGRHCFKISCTRFLVA